MYIWFDDNFNFVDDAALIQYIHKTTCTRESNETIYANLGRQQKFTDSKWGVSTKYQLNEREANHRHPHSIDHFLRVLAQLNIECPNYDYHQNMLLFIYPALILMSSIPFEGLLFCVNLFKNKKKQVYSLLSRDSDLNKKRKKHILIWMDRIRLANCHKQHYMYIWIYFYINNNRVYWVK